MSKKLTLTVLILIFAASSWALFVPGFFKIHDFTHAARIAQMSQALGDGHFPVRWTKDFGYGHGMPLFEFYAPLPFYLGALIFNLTQNLIFSMRSLFLLSNLVSLLGAYFLGKKVWEFAFSTKRDQGDNLASLAGLVLSAAFTLAPYRAVNLFIRGALSEAWGLMMIPWILWALIKVVKREKNSELFLILSLVALSLSHNLSVIIFAPFALAFTATITWLQLRGKPLVGDKLKEILLSLLKSGLIAFGLTSFYLVPSFFEKDYTQVSQIVLSDYFNFRLHFLYIRQFFVANWGFGGSEWGPQDGFSFFLGYPQLIALTGLNLFWIYSLIRQKLSSKRLKVADWLLIGSNLALLVALMLTTQKSLFVWQAFSFMQYIQFPWRYLMIVISFLGLSLVLSLGQIKDQKLRKIVGWLLLGSLVVANAFYFRPESYLDDPQALYYADQERIAREMSGILPDYLPKAVDPDIAPTTAVVLEPSEVYRDSSLNTSDDIEVLIDDTHQKLIRTNYNQPREIVWSLAYFPGWKAELNGEEVELSVTEQGLIANQVPAGEQQLGIKFGSTPLRLISDYLSLASLLYFVYAYLLSSDHD